MKGILLTRITGITLSVLLVAVFLVAPAAHAIPTLQLDIGGDTYYDESTETIVTTSDLFTVYAYLIPDNKLKNTISDTYSLSIALSPKTSTGGDYGSFTVNGSTVDVTGDMTYGTAPIEDIVTAQGWDGGDLPKHGVFPTYFTELSFQYASGDQLNPYNTQDRARAGLPLSLTGSGMYYAAFSIDASLLDPEVGIHFDLYNTRLKGSGDIDVTQFAPFSHDAEYVRKVPEPSTILLLGSGIVLLHLIGMGVRRRSGARL